MPTATARITLDFDVWKEPIEGRLRGDHGNERTFTGYMQLVTALEAALGEARAAGDPHAASAKGGLRE